MELLDINLTAIVILAFIGMALGALWYLPILLGNQWMQSIGKTADTLGSTVGPMIGSVIANILTATGVCILFTLLQVTGIVEAVGIGLVIGLLIIFPALWSDNLFCGWGKQLLLIQSGYRILTVLLMSTAMVYIP